MNLAFPAVVSNTILHRMVGDWTRQRTPNIEIRRRMRESVGKAKMGGALQLPSFRVAARDIEALEAGTLLRFPLASSNSAEFRVVGVPIFAASPVRRGDHRGAHLTAAMK
jgi:flagellar motor switch protein FliM